MERLSSVKDQSSRQTSPAVNVGSARKAMYLNRSQQLEDSR